MTCTIDSMPLAVARAGWFRRASAERIPMSASVEIIATCNFRCHHCYIAPNAEREDVMPLARAQRLFETLVEHGTLSLLLTGGEVFTHRDFREIFLSAKRLGLMTSVNTNAYLIGERWADFLAEWPPELVSISMYGLSDESYQRVTGIPNAFRRVVRAVDLLLERGIRLELKCPAMTSTVDELAGMRAFAESRGVKFRFDSIINPEERGDLSPLKLQLAPRRVRELDDVFDPGLEGLRSYAARGELTASDQVYRCGGGKIALAINVHGGASTCLTSRQVVGNVFEQPFEEVWAALGGKVARRFPDGHPCGSCKLRAICAGCPATAETVTGLPEGYVQQYCQLTHLRAHALGLHPTGIPRTVTEGIPAHVRTPSAAARRLLPVVQ